MSEREKTIKLKILADADGNPLVVDAETGAVIEGVSRVDICMLPFEPVRATIEISQPAVEIQAIEVQTLGTKLVSFETIRASWKKYNDQSCTR